MRKWLKSLTGSPRGFAADGRRLGLGLATAMEKQRQATADKAEQYLREQPAAHKAAVKERPGEPSRRGRRLGSRSVRPETSFCPPEACCSIRAAAGDTRARGGPGRGP